MAALSVRTFAPLMRQSVTIERKSGYGSYGEKTYSAAVTYRCAVIGDMKKVRTASGEEVVSKQQVYVMSNAAFTPEDRVTLSTQDVGSTESAALQPLILAVSRYPFLSGQFFTMLAL